VTTLQVLDTVRLNRIGRIVYALCRVASYKHTMKHFPHEVHHLELCLSVIGDSQVGRNWLLCCSITNAIFDWRAHVIREIH
jgi:hypothetical protein